MNGIIEILKQHDGKVVVNEDGIEGRFQLLPALSEVELSAFEQKLPCPMPREIRELLQFARGFNSGGALEEISFCGSSGGIGLDQIFPHALSLAADGFGNYWIVDATPSSKTWGPIFYACHDAPVIVFQTDSLLHFVEEVIRFGNKPWKSEIDDVHEELSDRIWRENPGVLSHEDCVSSSDLDLKKFAASLDASWQFIDLRNANLGDGFSWGRYGARTRNCRFGDKRIFAYQKKSLGRRFLDAIK